MKTQMNHATSSYARSGMRGKRSRNGNSTKSKGSQGRRTRGGKLYTGKASPELKFYDLTETAVLTTSLANPLGSGVAINAPAQGDTQSERIGNRIIVKSIQVKGYFTLQGVATGTLQKSNVARIMFFVDHQANGGYPTATDVLQNVGNINSFRNLDHSARFTMLTNIRMDLHGVPAYSGTALASVDQHFSFSFYKKLNMLTQFEGSTAAITSVTNNSIIPMAFMEDTGAPVSVFFDTRIRYTG